PSCRSVNGMKLLQSHIILLFTCALPCLGVLDLHISPEITAKISTAVQRLLPVLESSDVSTAADASIICRVLPPPLRVRVGVIQYSATPQLEFRLDSFFTKEDLQEKIKAIVLKGGSTETGLALKYILRKGFPGGRDSSVPKILIILSDGKSQGNLGGPAAQIKESGIEVFAIGVKFPRWAELHSLASNAVEEHVFFAEHVDDAMNGLCSSLSNSSACSAVPAGKFLLRILCLTPMDFQTTELDPIMKTTRDFTFCKTGLGCMCWKRYFTKHQSECHRTTCPAARFAAVMFILPSLLIKLLIWPCHKCDSCDPDPCDSQPCKNGGTCIPEGADKYHCICPVGFGGDAECAPKLSLECNIDLLFLLDSSSSSSLETFMRHKSFLKRFIQASLSDESPVNVGVAQYSSDVQMVVKINEYENIAELLKMVDSMQFLGGGLYTGKALRYVTQHGFKSTPAFSDVRDDLPRVVVLLTGSTSQDAVAEPASYARDHEVFLIGVSSETSKEEMAEIVANPHNLISYDSPQKLFNQLPQLQKRICSIDSQG
ncbi:hypothetical protein AB205_0071220, partial [Aquarana catesbeiana]